jgi:cytochrome c5
VRRASVCSAILLLAAGLFLFPADAAARRPKKKKAAAKTKPVAQDFDPRLPILGTRLAEMPPGPGKATADTACMNCHSADMVAQQRLTEKQWSAEVTKMAGWGADVPAARKDELIAYLVKNFGTDAPKYDPVITRPVGR